MIVICGVRPALLFAVERTLVDHQVFSASEAHQGVAVDGKYFYAIGTAQIGKYSKTTGEQVAVWSEAQNKKIIHLDSGVIVNGKLYCAHSNYPALPMTSSVEIWDAFSMQHVGSHSFGIDRGSCTWIDRYKGFWWAVFAHYDKLAGQTGKSADWTTLVKFNDSWQELETWVFPAEVIDKFQKMSNSGGSWGPDGLLYCTGHDAPEIYALQLPLRGSKLELVEVISAPNAGQGLAWDRSDPGRIYMIRRNKREVVTAKLEKTGIQLRQGNFMTEEQAVKELQSFKATYPDLPGWITRAEMIRSGILHGAELIPAPAKNPLHPIFRDKRVYNGYSVENVAFEALPGYYVTGNLYRPVDRRGPYAAVLCPHGHFPDPNGGGRFRPDMQLRCATLARMGAVVFAYDMVGWGESTQFKNFSYHKSHSTYKKAVALQIWNGIRSLDFLETLENVDPQRIGVTGASGGGTQTFLLTAVDKRVAVSVPVVMVSAHFFGGCVCESGMPIHQSKNHVTDNVEIAALAAPRPMLLVSDGDDWTKNTPDVEFPFIRDIYKLYGAEDKVANFHLPDEGHDYGFSKRVPVYRFMAEHLNLDLPAVTDAQGGINEQSVKIEEESALHVFSKEHPRPSTAVKEVAW
jgi:dienelactone hydrolase